MLTSSSRRHGGLACVRTAALIALFSSQLVVAGVLHAQSSNAGNSGAVLTRVGSPFEIVIETQLRVLFVLQGTDTLLLAPIGVATGRSFSYGNRRWRYVLPQGERSVRRKIVNPVWVPPDWHYAEAALNHDLRLVRLPPSGFTLLSGARLEIHNNSVGIVYPESVFAELPVDEHIVFEGRLFVPPLGTNNRRVQGSLGSYALDLGGGYLIHGTTNEASIGEASTHGCIRVRADDLRWLFDNIPLGTRVLVR